ncbi:MAG: type II toxin-antitoxin system HicA family toxin [Armatimonadota bacterium]|nr:type II toxin-antitoxin system HicA family toxin [Armatimonadota bacterium]
MTSKELIRLLKQNGWSETHRRGSHIKFSKGGKSVSVPYHNRDMAIGTVERILKQAGLK